MAKGNQKEKIRLTPLLGAHFSISGGLHLAFDRASKYQCTALQIFTKNASTWKERQLSQKEVALFDKARKKSGIRHVAAHASYLINIASPEREKRRKSVDALRHELLRCNALGIENVVLHPGAHMGSGRQAGLKRIADGIRGIFSETGPLTCRLLLETTAGQGTSLGHRFEHLDAILQKVDAPSRTGICLDTSHVFAAGYDIRNSKAYDHTIAAFDGTIGLKHLHLIHLNDSKKGLATRVDRHDNIGRGHIGLAAFECIMNDSRLVAIPKILETPKTAGGKDWDRINLEKLKRLIQS